MKKIIFAVLVVGIVAGIAINKVWVNSRPSTKFPAGPAVRYHGYKLNRKAIENAKKFTVLICSEGFSPHYRGTGMLIDSMHVLTADHMVPRDGNELWIYVFPGRKVVHAKAIFESERDDLAVLEIDEKINNRTYATFEETHYIGEPITIIGNILGSMRWYVSYGVVSDEWDGYILMDGTMTHGDSGGPWINEAGQVIALSDWQLSDTSPGDAVKGGVSARTIRAFLRRWKEPSVRDVLQMLLGGN